MRRNPKKRAAIGAALALVAAGVSASIFLFTRSRAPSGNEEAAPEPIPVERIAWPEVRREAESAFADARRGLEHGLALYSSGDRAAADAKLLESLGALERCGALVPEVGGYHYQTVTTPVL
ncbi:MAG TPA: hypothetical protein VMT52_18410, partial [Planctomycetota bacterium]|nr:hypothetical protein [Planctomycetota bacterium]